MTEYINYYNKTKYSEKYIQKLIEKIAVEFVKCIFE
jgi:hypothetical protein